MENNDLLNNIETICNHDLLEQQIRENILYYNDIMREIKKRTSEKDDFYMELSKKAYVNDKTFQKLFLLIESVIEKVSAEKFIQFGNDAILEEKIIRHTPLMQLDGNDLGLTSSSKVLLIGSGAIPITGIILSKKFNCRVVCVDIDAEAIDLSKKVISIIGLNEYFSFCCNNVLDFDNTKYLVTDAIITAFLMDKNEILNKLMNENKDIGVLIRQPRGPYSYIYDKTSKAFLEKLHKIHIDDNPLRGHYISIIGRTRNDLI